ncbi:MAG: hypothetical protein JSW34_08530 [Candidatus Zixiibacteriota bacterium]|nr:MAG: hypothetical protein JSW34_08530 [candidate division Zixibacteria bacterium]
MPEDVKQSEDNKAEPKAREAGPKAGRGGMFKYIAIAGAVLVVTVVVAVGVAFVMKGKSSGGDDSTEKAERPKLELKKTAGKDAGHAQANSEAGGQAVDDEAGMEELDDSAIEKILDNLAFLDYEPSEDELAEDEGRMTKEDSLEQVNWLDKEKATLTRRTKELDARERELNKLEQKVNQSLLKLEQVESNRIAGLAKLYDGMDPRAVAKLLANLDDETVVAILPRMKLKNASAVLQLMPAQRAARLSKQMITVAEK